MQTIAVELRREGRREGRAEGEHTLREAVYDVLQTRFGMVPEEVQTRLEALHGLTTLRQAAVQAALAESMAAFETWLAGRGENGVD